MGEVPEGATLSEDGNYWWDGSEWQPVDGDAGGEPEMFGQSAGVDGAAIEVLVCNRGAADAPPGSFAGTIAFERYDESSHDPAGYHDLYIAEVIPATECRTMGVMVLPHHRHRRRRVPGLPHQPRRVVARWRRRLGVQGPGWRGRRQLDFSHGPPAVRLHHAMPEVALDGWRLVEDGDTFVTEANGG